MTSWQLQSKTHSQAPLLAGIAECVIDILFCWRAFLLESPPMVGLQMCALVDPELVQFPIWVWLSLIVGIGFLVASLSVHMELRAKIKQLEAIVGALPPQHLQQVLKNHPFHEPHLKSWSAEA